MRKKSLTRRSRRKVARALPPLPAGALDQFEKRARGAISASKATFDYASAIYLLELKKQKYAERSKKGNSKTWWKAHLEDLCPYVQAANNLRIIRAFKTPDAQKNLAEFGSTKLELAIRYCNANRIDIPPDPRDLTVHFIDDSDNERTKPFPQCAVSDLLLAVHGKKAPGPDSASRKLDKDQQGMLDAARKSISGFIVSPERHVVTEWEGEKLSFSVLKISEGYLMNTLDALAKAVTAFLEHPDE